MLSSLISIKKQINKHNPNKSYCYPKNSSQFILRTLFIGRKVTLNVLLGCHLSKKLKVSHLNKQRYILLLFM